MINVNHFHSELPATARTSRAYDLLCYALRLKAGARDLGNRHIELFTLPDSRRSVVDRQQSGVI